MLYLAARLLDIVQQRVDGGGASAVVGACPVGVAKARPCLLLDTLSKIPNRAAGDGSAGAFGNRVASAKDSGRPGILPFQCGGCGERDEGVDESKSVADLPAADETFMDQRNCRVSIFSLNGGDRSDVQRQVQEPRARMSKH